eukprot:gene438-2434_t
MNLAENGISGSIPSLHSMTGLWYLNMSQSDISGTVPDLAALTGLKYLQLYETGLSGSIPGMSRQSLLSTLQLDDSRLSGTLPPGAWTNLTSLQVLSVQRNQLSGDIPDLSALTALLGIQLSTNGWTGTVPTTLSGLTLLELIDIGESGLVGTVPDLSSLTSLRRLRLHSNSLGGTIPSFGALRNLDDLDLANNAGIFGTIPDLSHLVRLRNLNLRNNSLSGSLDLPFLPASLKNVWLDSNYLEGAIPSFDQFASLSQLQLGSNHLTGTVPQSLAVRPVLAALVLLPLTFPVDPHAPGLSGACRACYPCTLCPALAPCPQDLSNNRITGSIPDDFIFAVNMAFLNLASNSLDGTIPTLCPQSPWNGDSPAAIWPILQDLDLSYNGLVGMIPPTLVNCLHLRTLDLSHNLLSGPLDLMLGRNCALSSIQLSHNRLERFVRPSSRETDMGSCPFDSLGRGSLFYGTISLDLSNNRITGTWPEYMLEKARVLETIDVYDLSHNLLHGPVPNVLDLSIATSLRTVALHGNNFSGRVTDVGALHRARRLASLDLRGNSLDGSSGSPADRVPEALQLLLVDGNPLQGNLSRFLASLGITSAGQGVSSCTFDCSPGSEQEVLQVSCPGVPGSQDGIVQFVSSCHVYPPSPRPLWFWFVTIGGPGLLGLCVVSAIGFVVWRVKAKESKELQKDKWELQDHLLQTEELKGKLKEELKEVRRSKTFFEGQL